MNDVQSWAEQGILYEEQGAVAVVTLNRPQALNSFTRGMHGALQAALRHAEANAALRALVVTGAGRGFCAGLDLSELDFTPGEGLMERANPGPVIEQCFNPTARAFMNLRMPTIAAVNGVAAGAGASLAMACDIAIAAPGASFVQAFSKIGLIPDAGGSWLLVERLGLEPDQLVAGQAVPPLPPPLPALLPAIRAEIDSSRARIDAVYALADQLAAASAAPVAALGTERARAAVRFTAALYALAWETSAAVVLPDWHRR